MVLVAGGAAAQGLPRVGVLPFFDLSRQAPADAGQRAARVLHGLLLDAGKHELEPLEPLWADAQAQGLNPPYAVGDLQLMAHRRQLDLVAQGTIGTYDYNGRRRRLSLEIAVEIADGVSGDLVVQDQGAATVEAGKQEQPSAEDLLVRALEQTLATIVKKHLGELRPTSQRPPPPAGTGGTTAGDTQVAPPPEQPPGQPVEPSAQPPKQPESPPTPGQPDTPPAPTAPDQPAQPSPPGTPEQPAQPDAPEQPAGPGTPGTPQHPAEPDQPANPPQPDQPGESPPPLPPLEPEPEEQLVPLVEAKVLVRIGKDKVLITLGRDVNVTKGMELEVWRQRWNREDQKMTRSRIGRVLVTKIGRTDAEARILEGGDLIGTDDLCLLFGP